MIDLVFVCAYFVQLYTEMFVGSPCRRHCCLLCVDERHVSSQIITTQIVFFLS